MFQVGGMFQVSVLLDLNGNKVDYSGRFFLGWVGELTDVPEEHRGLGCCAIQPMGGVGGFNDLGLFYQTSGLGTLV